MNLTSKIEKYGVMSVTMFSNITMMAVDISSTLYIRLFSTRCVLGFGDLLLEKPIQDDLDDEGDGPQDKDDGEVPGVVRGLL
jgi:hypothetical protein